MTRLLLILFLLFSTFIIIGELVPVNQKTNDSKLIADAAIIQTKAIEALDFCKSKKMNTSFCILIDMSIHSGLKRLFVFDFQSDTIIFNCLVGHGCGNNYWSSDDSKTNPQFSNVSGSHCTSLGKYKIGERGYSNWGINIKYLLHGLENTNNNALQRQIVFHGWDLMPDEEVYPSGSPEGWGCPTVSNNSMRTLEQMLQNAKKPVLMWIYN